MRADQKALDAWFGHRHQSQLARVCGVAGSRDWRREVNWSDLTKPQQAALIRLYRSEKLYAGRAFAVYRNLEREGLARSMGQHNCYEITAAGCELAKRGIELSTAETTEQRVERLYQEAMKGNGE
jgi:hypothetical protein